MSRSYVKSILRIAAAIILAAGLIPQIAISEDKEPTMPEYKEYLGRLLGTRDTWPDDMTEAESAVMQKHFEYLRDLTAQKKVLMAGPVLGRDPKFGLVVLRVASLDEAHDIMKNDPSVQSGLHTYELSEMSVALMAHHVPRDRYAAAVTDRVLHKEVTVPGTLSDVWRLWTTDDGLRSFFSPNSHIELRVGGPFEILFSMDSPVGERGSEDCRILSWLPERMLSYEWNAPPSLGPMRQKHSHVVILFEEAGPGKVRVDFNQYGWGEGEGWQKVYEYFDRAWSYVLGNFEKRMTSGPINWEE